MDRTALLAPLAGTPIVRRAVDTFARRYAHYRALQLDHLDVPAVQRETLLRLVRKARHTQFGRDHQFRRITSVADFQALVPVRTYEWFWDTYWKNLFPRIDNVTWPGKMPYYALSSGTTSGTTKFVPVSWEMVDSNKKAAFTTTGLFRHAYPDAQIFRGKFFFLGGSTDMRPQADGSFAGDLSGIAAKEILDVSRQFFFPPKELTLMTNWEEKMNRFAERSIHEPVTAISGIPAWTQRLFARVKELTGKKTVAEVWPRLRMVIHGGTKFEPFRDLFRKEIGSD
ncbi:MAG: GH3 auxin-responsive promoter family protein, partial [Gemmataceae bacterium]|nr:GH3 auxin-responsive promoter family protein [Gemmataceae bacterium]